MTLRDQLRVACLSLLCCMASGLHAQVIPGCHRDADEDARVETARSILKVNARVDPVTGVEDVDHYYRVIYFWAERGSG